MEKTRKEIHRGNVLHQIAEAHPNSIKEIVAATGYQYGTFFKHIKEKKLSYLVLAKYGRAMNKDFSVEFPEMADMPFILLPQEKVEDLSAEQEKEYNQDVRSKYLKLLEKHNHLLEEVIVLRDENRQLREGKFEK